MTVAVRSNNGDRWSVALVDEPRRERRKRNLVLEDEVDQRLRHVAAERSIDARAHPEVISDVRRLDQTADVRLRRIDRRTAGEADALRVGVSRCEQDQKQSHGAGPDRSTAKDTKDTKLTWCRISHSSPLSRLCP